MALYLENIKHKPSLCRAVLYIVVVIHVSIGPIVPRRLQPTSVLIGLLLFALTILSALLFALQSFLMVYLPLHLIRTN